MTKHIAIIHRHPDPSGDHFDIALANAYAKGVSVCGNEVRIIDVEKLDFPLLRTKEEIELRVPPDLIRQAQERICTIGGAVLGAFIGGIAGGGKAAAIGAIIGAGSIYVQGRKDLILEPDAQMIVRTIGLHRARASR